MRLTALALLLVLPVLRADEGMWTFDNLPLRQLKEKYGFVHDVNEKAIIALPRTGLRSWNLRDTWSGC